MNAGDLAPVVSLWLAHVYPCGAFSDG